MSWPRTQRSDADESGMTVNDNRTLNIQGNMEVNCTEQ